MTLTTTLSGVELRPLVVPASLDAPDAGEFVEMTAVRNQIYRELTGHDDFAMTPAELLPFFDEDAYVRKHVWAVLLDGRLVGRVVVELPLEDGSRTLFWQVELLEEVSGRGIGSQAYALVEQTAREHGRTVLQAWAQHTEAPGERMVPPTGFGSIPAGDRAARFFRRHGYTLEQVERASALDLTAPPDRIEALRDEARRAADGYRVVGWFAPTPPEFAEGYAWVKSRMSTDTPMAELVFDEERWDTERVARYDEKMTSGGRTVRVAAAQHLATGELVAFNELVIGPDRSGATHQEDTLVLKEHRGHRLGMLVKCENLLAWRRHAPQSPRVITYNAEENRPMLDINETIGFVPIAYEGAWKKVLSQ